MAGFVGNVNYLSTKWNELGDSGIEALISLAQYYAENPESAGGSGGQHAGGPAGAQPLMYLTKSVTKDTTITNGNNVLAIDELIVEEGVTLTLDDEVVLKVV